MGGWEKERDLESTQAFPVMKGPPSQTKSDRLQLTCHEHEKVARSKAFCISATFNCVANAIKILVYHDTTTQARVACLLATVVRSRFLN